MLTETEKMLAGDLYDASDPELVADRRRAAELTREYNHTAADETARRRDVLDELFGSIGGDVEVTPPFYCDYGYNIAVGERFYANVGCVVLDVCPVSFGDNCLLGPGVHVYAATHPIDADKRAEGLECGRPVSVGDDVWIGGQAVLTPGVDVGDRAVVAAGAVVTRDVPPDVVVGGNPAEVLRDLS